MATQPSQRVLSETKVGIKQDITHRGRPRIITTIETVFPISFSVSSLPFVLVRFGV